MKKTFLTACIGLVFSTQTQAQTLYDATTIQVIQLTFSQPNWDYQLDTAKSGSQGYTLAAACVINGFYHDSVGVKYKGTNTYNAANLKNPLHIALDYVQNNQAYQGYTDIKLGNCSGDPSMLREVLGYEVLRNYMDAPLSNYAKVYINGNYVGLYSSTESIGKSFYGDHFYSNDNTAVQCSPIATTGASDLKYIDNNTASYSANYQLSNGSLQDLIRLCDTLNNQPVFLDKVLDIDRAIWMLAFNNALANLDSYTGATRQNYYLYKDDNNRFCPIIANLNTSIGGFTNLGMGNILDTNGLKNLHVFANGTSANHPLLQQIMNNPSYKKRYIAHLKTIVTELFQSGTYITRANQLRNLIDNDVYSDANKFFTNTQFDNSLNTNITGASPIIGLSNLINGRVSYLNTTPEFNYTAPTIATIQVSNPTATIFTAVSITAQVTNATVVELAYRYASPGIFVKTPMYDDGMHGDGGAGDGVYGANLSLNSAKVQYYIYAENANAGIFSPARAEHEFYTILPTVIAPTAGQLVINEFMTKNNAINTDPNGQYEDWIEVYNNSASALSLDNVYLSDNSTNPTKWQFPKYATIPANGYVIVWCDSDKGQSGYHASFKLKSSGDTLLLSTASSTLESNIYSTQTSNLSRARCPNGTGNFSNAQVPSPVAFNMCGMLGIDNLNNPSNNIQAYPNPTASILNLVTTYPTVQIDIIDITGRIVISNKLAASTNFSIDMQNLSSGLYTFLLKQENGNTNTLKIAKQ